jgi:hypothetical protein
VDELTEMCDLTLLVGTYLRGLSLPSVKIENLVKFYLSIRKETAVRLTDGTGHKPHYRCVILCHCHVVMFLCFQYCNILHVFRTLSSVRCSKVFQSCDVAVCGPVNRQRYLGIQKFPKFEYAPFSMVSSTNKTHLYCDNL